MTVSLRYGIHSYLKCWFLDTRVIVTDFLVSILIPSVSWSRSKRPLESPGRVTLENELKPKPFPWVDIRALL